MNDLVQLVSFKVGSGEFGVDMLKIQEINRMAEITKVPHASAYVEGLINLRGKVIPIVNLRKRLNLESKEHDRDTRMIIIDINSNIIGMVVDSVSEVLRLPSNTIEASLDAVYDINSEYIKGVAKLNNRLIMLLDLSKVIDIDEMSHLVK